MDEFEGESDLDETVRHIVRLSRSAPADRQHKTQLRRELLQRHHSLYGEGRRRWWWKAGPLRRLALAGPPALAAAVIAGAVLIGLQVSGHQQPAAADAQRLSAAMVKTAPTVTGWQMTVTKHESNSADTRANQVRLTANEHFYILRWRGKLVPYLYVGRHPHGIPAEAAGTWQYVFALLPDRLKNHQARVLPETRSIHGRTAAGVQYMLTQGHGLLVRAVAWVDEKSGRVLSLEREVLRGGHVVEEDWAHYEYAGGR
jgi:hypothetical protein